MENENLEFSFPQKVHKQMWLSFVNEFIQNNERIVPGIARIGDGTYETFYKAVTDFHNSLNLSAEFVPSSTYFLIDRSRKKILSVASIRHRLNEYLLNIGGHVGYGVVPSERLKGYATKTLALSLEKCREMNIHSILITCDKENIGSTKTILKNGGVLENEFAEETGNIIQRYWIKL